MTECYIIDRRVSTSYYSYALELYCSDELVDIEYYGDMAYWGRTDQRSYDEALRELLERNHLAKDKIRIIQAGFYSESDSDE